MALGKMNALVQMSGRLFARDDRDCNGLEIERMNAKPATAADQQREIIVTLPVLVDPQ